MKQQLAFFLLKVPIFSWLIRRYYMFRYYRSNSYLDGSVALFDHETAYQEFYNPELESRLPGRHKSKERWEIIKPFFDSLESPQAVLDIGPANGYFLHALASETAHRATGVETSFRFAAFLEQTKHEMGLDYEVINTNVFSLSVSRLAAFDVVVALSIFHHFLKTEELFNSFDRLLGRIDSEYMIFQPHNSNEEQMQDIYKTWSSEEFISYVQEKARMPYKKVLGTESSNGRTVYLLSKQSLA